MEKAICEGLMASYSGREMKEVRGSSCRTACLRASLVSGVMKVEVSLGGWVSLKKLGVRRGVPNFGLKLEASIGGAIGGETRGGLKHN